jgi:hypothetical protein
MLDRENVAAIQHEIWSHWMKYLFSTAIFNEDGSVTIAADKVIRWTKQLGTHYSQLSEKNKNSDRDQADKIIAII